MDLNSIMKYKREIDEFRKHCSEYANSVQQVLINKYNISSERNNYVITIYLLNDRVINGKPFDALSVSIAPDRTGNFGKKNPSVME